ncbi:MAG: hypothetical protein ACYS17_14400 [Planctomycetota bacterium]
MTKQGLNDLLPWNQTSIPGICKNRDYIYVPAKVAYVTDFPNEKLIN